MDPDAARKRLCELSTEIGHWEDAGDNEHVALLAEDMASMWDGLDAWLRHGGFPPKVWGSPNESGAH